MLFENTFYFVELAEAADVLPLPAPFGIEIDFQIRIVCLKASPLLAFLVTSEYPSPMP